jgi:hypothetical protein
MHWERLQEEGFTGGYTIVKDAVRQLRRISKEVYLPLKHPPGEAQVDFGHALVKIGGVLGKVSQLQDPTEIVAFHSDEGREMVRAMAGAEWRAWTPRDAWDVEREMVV